MAEIILVTHGEAEADKYNPSLTKEGRKQMEEIKSQLSDKSFDCIISGVGKRHQEACKIIAGKTDIIREQAGVIETLSSDGKSLIFEKGKKLAINKYRNILITKIIPQTRAFLRKCLEDQEKILIVGGRVVALAAGIPEEKVKSAHVYYIGPSRSKGILIRD